MRCIAVALAGLMAIATPALALDLRGLSPTDLARVDRQCDVLRFRQPSSLVSDAPESPPPSQIVSDPSGYWADNANGMDEALSKVDLSSLTIRQCRDAGFYDN